MRAGLTAQAEAVIHVSKATIAKDNGPQYDAIKTGNLQSTVVGPHGPPSSFIDDQNGDSAPMSPYSANRAAVRNLTMPIMPNFDIPPSPPGSPIPGMEQKFEHFLQLKKQGIHFNEKLARSSALKNPALLQKLMASAGLEENDQYLVALPQTLLDPLGFPEWAYKENLAKSQQQFLNREERSKLRRQRESIEFVAPAGQEMSINGKNGEF
ncbi:MAG: hypothetical protein LQ344_007029 [Seirophora lacunosa]|nr:MAG: hypothetical protein LQ344_007029 [Seirophora lacunosa]